MLSRTALCINNRALSRMGITASEKIAYRSLHITCRIRKFDVKCTRSALKLSRYSPVLGSYAKRYSSTIDTANTIAVSIPTGSPISASTSASTSTPTSIPTSTPTSEISAESIATTTVADVPIPPAPTPLDGAVYIGEVPFSELGLGGWYPPGLVQQGLEFLHISCGLPWWESIALATVVLRILVFPLVILAQRNAAKMNNNMPEMMRLQTELSEARYSGDQLLAARKARDLMEFMKEKKCSPLKNMLVPMAQAPVFISVFMGLRKMANLPVASMEEGGLWWFTDLTVADPYYILPVITAATLALTIELGVDSAKARNMGYMRHFLRALPIITIPFTIRFPAAILIYWASSNFISLIQVGILRLPKCRAFFKIEPLINHSSTLMQKSGQKGFIEGFKSSISNMKTSREMNARYQTDAIQFHRAGMGPVKKTFLHDPTKPMPIKMSSTTAAAKKT